MPGLDSARLRRLADELDAEEAEAKRELADAETKEERDEIRSRIERLEQENAELREQVKERKQAEKDDPAAKDDPDTKDDPVVEDDPKPKMRKGRKHGNVYMNPDTGMGEVYTGDDEDDLVPVEEQTA